MLWQAPGDLDLVSFLEVPLLEPVGGVYCLQLLARLVPSIDGSAIESPYPHKEATVWRPARVTHCLDLLFTGLLALIQRPCDQCPIVSIPDMCWK